MSDQLLMQNEKVPDSPPSNNAAKNATENNNNYGIHASENSPSPESIDKGYRYYCNSREHSHPTTKADIFMAAVGFFTLVAVIAYTIITGILLFDNRDVAKSQKLQSEAQIRPWIKVDGVGVYSDIVISNKEWSVSVSSTLYNIGASPARDIDFGTLIVPVNNAESDIGKDIQAWLRYSCVEARQPNLYDTKRAPFLFQGGNEGVVTTENAFTRIVNPINGKIVNPVNVIVVIVYAVYKYTFTDEIHCTAVARQFSRKDGKSLLPITQSDVVESGGRRVYGISKDNIVISDIGIGSLYAD